MRVLGKKRGLLKVNRFVNLKNPRQGPAMALPFFGPCKSLKCPSRGNYAAEASCHSLAKLKHIPKGTNNFIYDSYIESGLSKGDSPLHNLGIIVSIYAIVAFVACGLANIPAQNQAIEEENMRVYKIYQSYMKSMNEQREETGITPERIKSFEEWKRSPGTK